MPPARDISGGLFGTPAVPNTTATTQVGETGSAGVVSTGTTYGVVSPFVADMYADASGTVGTLQEVSVTMTGLDTIINVTLNEADSVHLLKGFKVQDLDVSGSNTAQVSVSMVEPELFKSALSAAISSESLVYTYLKAESRKDTVDILSYDTLINMLEAADLLTYDIELDVSGAANNMQVAMVGGSAAYRKAMFTQIPKATLETYMAPGDGESINYEEVKTLNFLPLRKGDKLTFVWDATVGEYAADNTAPATGARISSVVNDASNATWSSTSADGSNAGFPAGSTTSAAVTTNNYAGSPPPAKLVFTTPSARRIALVIQLTDGTGTFATTAVDNALGVPGELSLDEPSA